MTGTRPAFMVLFLAFFSTSAAAQRSGAIVIVNANVIDGVAAEPIRGATVVVRNGRIAEVRAEAAQAQAEAGARVIDLKGKWLLPGFIDGHVHITDRSGARLALRSGVTTARSMGVSHFV
ncbi:MAG: amidohydrolase family protein, partial [Candidatus Acidiferrales bacterium]